MTHIIKLATRSKFLDLAAQESIVLKDHWTEPAQPDRRLRVVARQLVLEDGTVVELRSGE